MRRVATLAEVKTSRDLQLARLGDLLGQAGLVESDKVALVGDWSAAATALNRGENFATRWTGDANRDEEMRKTRAFVTGPYPNSGDDVPDAEVLSPVAKVFFVPSRMPGRVSPFTAITL